MADPRRFVPVVGIAACAVVLAGLAVPFVLADPGQVGLYYDSGAVNPLVAGLFAVLSIVVFAAGREGRTDPALAAGVTLTMGVFTTVVAVAWALTVRVDVVDAAAVSAHPLALAVVSLSLPAAATWYARSLGLF